MPGFDKLGPTSTGTMTGKGRGYCMRELEAGEKEQLLRRVGQGRGMLDGGAGSGRGMGRGRGRGRGINCLGLQSRMVNDEEVQETED